MELIGIDLGGTKIEGVAIDPARPGEALARIRRPTEQERGYEHILEQIAAIVEELRSRYPEAVPALGIGTPGTLDARTGALRGSNTQCLNGRPIKADLEARLGMRVEIENDANCFALAEATLGAARGCETVFGIILGTGVGGGIVIRERILHGHHGIAGEWGQIVIEPEGPVSAYGTRGTVEACLSGPGLERFYASRSGLKRSLKEIVEQEAEDAAARETLERMEEVFVKAIALVINCLDPDAIVVGGGVGNIGRFYSERIRERIGEAIFAPKFEAALLKPALGDSAGVFGAAMLTRE